MTSPRLVLTADAPACLTRARARAVLLATALAAHASPLGAATDVVIARADLAVTFRSATECHVRLQVTADGPRDELLDHRLRIHEGTEVDPPRVTGARAAAPARVARTLALGLANRDATYAIEYTVRQPREARFRCPVWLPTVPTRPGPGRVRLRISLPPGAEPTGNRFPLVSWTGRQGEAMLGDVPSLVRATFSAPGQELHWTERVDAGRAADLLAVVTLGAGSLAWVVGRRRRRR